MPDQDPNLYSTLLQKATSVGAPQIPKDLEVMRGEMPLPPWGASMRVAKLGAPGPGEGSELPDTAHRIAELLGWQGVKTSLGTLKDYYHKKFPDGLSKALIDRVPPSPDAPRVK